MLCMLHFNQVSLFGFDYIKWKSYESSLVEQRNIPMNIKRFVQPHASYSKSTLKYKSKKQKAKISQMQ